MGGWSGLFSAGVLRAGVLRAGGLCVLGALLWGPVPGEAQEATQTVALAPGWNAVFLEVQPEPRNIAAAVGALPIERIVMWLGSPQTVQFIDDADAILPEDPAWLTWMPDAAGIVPGPALHTLLANRAYLVRLGGTEPREWTLGGVPEYRAIAWKEDSYTLTGLRVPETNAPAATLFFGASLAHAGGAPLRLSPDGTWHPLEGADTPLRKGEAYWVYTQGASVYQGPVGLRLEQGRGLRFSASLPEVTFTLDNATTAPQVCSLAVPEGGAGGFTLSLWQEPGDGAPGAWQALEAASSVEVPAQGSRQVRLALRQEAAAAKSVTPPKGLLRIRSDAGAEYLLSIMANVVPPDRAGLWVGNVEVNQVSENIRQHQTAPTKTDAPFQFRLLMHVAEGIPGEFTLLRQVVQAVEPGSEALVLLSDPQRISSLLENAVEGERPVARRLSTAIVGGDVVAGVEALIPPVWSGEACAVDPEAHQVQFTYVLDYDDPLNPFKHRYHIDHDNLQSDFTTRQGEGMESFTVTRTITLRFTCDDPRYPESAVSPDVQWGGSTLGGVYEERIFGILPDSVPPPPVPGDEPDIYGSLQVNLTPATGEWMLDALTPTGDTPRYKSGDVVHGIPVGEHLISFTPVAGYQWPAPMTVEVLPYADQEIPETVSTVKSKTYTAGTGPERVADGDNFIHLRGHFTLRRVVPGAALNP